MILLLLLLSSACYSMSESQREQALIAFRSGIHNDHSGTRPQGDALQLAGWYLNSCLQLPDCYSHAQPFTVFISEGPVLCQLKTSLGGTMVTLETSRHPSWSMKDKCPFISIHTARVRDVLHPSAPAACCAVPHTQHRCTASQHAQCIWLCCELRAVSAWMCCSHLSLLASRSDSSSVRMSPAHIMQLVRHNVYTNPPFLWGACFLQVPRKACQSVLSLQASRCVQVPLHNAGAIG